MGRHVLYPFCTTDKQREWLDAIKKHGGVDKVITYSRQHGEVFRISINPEMAGSGGLQ